MISQAKAKQSQFQQLGKQLNGYQGMSDNLSSVEIRDRMNNLQSDIQTLEADAKKYKQTAEATRKSVATIISERIIYSAPVPSAGWSRSAPSP